MADYGENTDAVDPEAQDQAQQDATGALKLQQLIGVPNIVVHLTEEKLTEIATKVCDEYDIDKDSLKDWGDRTKAAMDLAMLVAEEKTYPFNKAANVKFPLVTTAALQFNARAYPAIVSGERVAKAKVDGKDPDGQKAARAERISEHMSSQLLDEMPEWEEDTDRLLVILPIVGCAFRKRYWDPSLMRQVSRLITADNLVVNYFARSLEDAPRVTERLYLYPYEIQERIRDGRFAKFDYDASTADQEQKSAEDSEEGSTQSDDDAPHLFLEQHRLLDLDGDDYPEPYIVTVHKGTQKVCRIVANFTGDTVHVDQKGNVTSIRKQDFYIKYLFLPSPDGGFYGMGLGTLLKDNNEAINTTLNMTLDAAHLATIQGGFISSALGIREKTVTIEAGTWKVINAQGGKISDNIMPFSYPGPSPVLFQLLGFLVDMGKDLASIKDVLTGEQRPNQTATATMALIEQGLKVFTAIFKRVHRSLKKELLIQAELNKKYLTAEAYNAFLDDASGQFDPKADYDMSTMDVVPVSDPSVSTQMQKLAKAAFIAEVAKENPLVNQEEALRRQFEAADIEDPDKLIAKPPQPSPEEQAMKSMMDKLLLEKTEAEVMDILSQVLLNAATADSKVSAGELGRSAQVLDALKTEVSTEAGQQQAAAQLQGQMPDGGQGDVSGLAGPADNAMGAQPPQGDGGAPGGGQPPVPVPNGQQPAAGVASPPA